MSTIVETADAYSHRLLTGIRKKADHNKAEAMRCIAIGLASSLGAPLFIALGDGLWFGRVVPSVLSLTAAFCTGWLQLRRPQLLWSLYRGAQREIEDQQTRYRFAIGDYAHVPDADRLLAERVADIAIGLHHKWAPLAPNPESVVASPPPLPKAPSRDSSL